MEKIAAVILAAGKGTRMNEGSSHSAGSGQASPIPKVMFEINNMPIIRYSVDNIKKAGIGKIVLVVGYRHDLVENYLGDEVEHALQAEQLGTGHATLMAKDLLVGKSEAVLVCPGDMPMFKPETIRNLIDEFNKQKATIAMSSIILDNPSFWAFGRVIRDKDNKVIDIIEQKDCSPKELEIQESNVGLFVFDAGWLWQNISKLNNDNIQKEYYLTDIVKLAAHQEKKIIALPISDPSEALGINTPEQLREAEKLLAKS